MTGPSLSAHLLEHHIRARGLREYVTADPISQYTTTFLRDLLAIVEQALTDEDISEAATWRVLNAVIYGSMPRGVDIHERARTRDQTISSLERASLPITIRVATDPPRAARRGPG